MACVKSEQRIVEEMIRLYCSKKHHHKALCPDCQALLDYALGRLERCPFQDSKSFCSHCPVHCYKPAMRKRVQEVMRFSGPRMLLHHPVLVVKHMIESNRR
ncbi:nitrous oxide-stimulated promoter family protein [Eubacterium sp. 1001713B170207_170306_E7]|uniref:nitrous oxide-stimulated promoter family protein n=1 Tax=Eubacterium sp. 1001713B170207_170306_E7 TaxID=2787097 RepID=UPI00189747F0|nr:nitrous oxide-stimulated promoter family protein [Eubacterium sp. 1001713B170207_170306_E7]